MQANYNNLSCQLGGLVLNGNIQNGTAQSNTVLTINDPSVVVDVSGSQFLKIKIGQEFMYVPVYKFT